MFLRIHINVISVIQQAWDGCVFNGKVYERNRFEIEIRMLYYKD